MSAFAELAPPKPLLALPPAPAAPALVPVPVARSVQLDDDLELVEVRSPLTIIVWAVTAMAGGIGTIAAMLVLGPIFGTVAVLVGAVALARRCAEAPEVDVSC